ncbi:glycosyl hydrolase family 28-related protein [Niallia taxi]|uniref:right-handed parallel beta-helix repeat-containing protein n=1 Tax=Niallia taxi TaxID=2499688 RepID=UPI003982AD3E
MSFYYSKITLNQETKDWINVSDYNADPTGNTDSSASIQAAINDASSSGKVVIFPPGTYRVDKTLKIIHPKQKAVKLMGIGADNSYYGIHTGDTSTVTITRSENSDHDLIHAEGRGLTIEGIVFDGKGTQGNAINITRGFELRIKNSHFYNIRGYAIEGYSVQNANIEGNHFNKSGSTNNSVLYLGGGKHGVTNTVNVFNNHFERNFGTDIEIATSEDEKDYAEFIFITNSHFESTDDTGGIIKSTPLLEVGKVRGLEVDNSFFYGGNGPLIKTVNDYAKGITVSNTFFLGDRTVGKKWEPLKSYKKGDFIVPSTRSGYIYIADKSGESGEVEPNFISDIKQYHDGTVEWKVFSNTIEKRGDLSIENAPSNLIELSKGKGISFIGNQFSTAKNSYIYIGIDVKSFQQFGNIFLHENESSNVTEILYEKK